MIFVLRNGLIANHHNVAFLSVIRCSKQTKRCIEALEYFIHYTESVWNFSEVFMCFIHCNRQAKRRIEALIYFISYIKPLRNLSEVLMCFIHCRLSVKLVPSFTNRCCHVVRVTDPYGRILDSLDRSRYFFQVAPRMYWRGWVDPVPDALLLRKCGSAGNRNRTSGSVAKISDH
jgi:hypothetical protein